MGEMDEGSLANRSFVSKFLPSEIIENHGQDNCLLDEELESFPSCIRSLSTRNMMTRGQLKRNAEMPCGDDPTQL